MEMSGIRTISELTGPQNPAKGSEELGKNAFLELMIAQFNNQNPLEPAKNEDFIAQLAQFSSVEGIQNLNASVESMASAMRSTTTLQAAALVGRSVLVPASQAYMDGQGLGGSISNDFPGSEVVVEITDGAGALVRRLPLGTQAGGNLRFTWDGIDETGEARAAGAYGVRAYAMADGEAVELEVELPEVVASVSFENGEANLNLRGGATVTLAEVRELQ